MSPFDANLANTKDCLTGVQYKCRDDVKKVLLQSWQPLNETYDEPITQAICDRAIQLTSETFDGFNPNDLDPATDPSHAAIRNDLILTVGIGNILSFTNPMPWFTQVICGFLNNIANPIDPNDKVKCWLIGENLTHEFAKCMRYVIGAEQTVNATANAQELNKWHKNSTHEHEHERDHDRDHERRHDRDHEHERDHDRDHKNEHEHEHDRDHERDHDHDGPQDHKNDDNHEHKRDWEHDHERQHHRDHKNEHEHDRDHERDHENDHDRDRDHDRDHDRKRNHDHDRDHKHRNHTRHNTTHGNSTHTLPPHTTVPPKDNTTHGNNTHANSTHTAPRQTTVPVRHTNAPAPRQTLPNEMINGTFVNQTQHLNFTSTNGTNGWILPPNATTAAPASNTTFNGTFNAVGDANGNMSAPLHGGANALGASFLLAFTLFGALVGYGCSSSDEPKSKQKAKI